MPSPTTYFLSNNKLFQIDKILYILLYVCETLLPAIPAVTFSLATFVSLQREESRSSKRIDTGGACLSFSSCGPATKNNGKSSVTHHGGEKWGKKRDATVTILALVGTYIVFNLPMWILCLGDAAYVFTSGRAAIWGSRANFTTYYMSYHVIYIHTALLNSITNAVIYFLRLKGLRQFVGRFCCRKNNGRGGMELVLVRSQVTMRLEDNSIVRPHLR